MLQRIADTQCERFAGETDGFEAIESVVLPTRSIETASS
jgi:hypothetical protein